MLSAVASQSWTRGVAIGQRAAIGWTGWKSEQTVFDDGHISVVVDGCFFNRDELPSGSSEAEITAKLYRQHGFRDGVAKINGDFAIALYDHDENELWLARDRVGAKPLYYVDQSTLFGFGSRARSLLKLSSISNEVNEQFVAIFAASHYRYFDNDPHASPYRDIAQLPAAHVLRWKDGSSKLFRYWSLEDLPDFADDEQQLADQYQELLMDAVRIRVQAADRPGFTLSGGMDSSSVLASAVRATGQKQDAFSTVYEDKTYDESDEIRTILDQTVNHWHTIALGTPDVMSTVRRMIDVHDEPVATATWLSHFLLCEQATKLGKGSLFGGLGGDELNAGEYEYFFFHFADLRLAGAEDQLRKEIKYWIEYHDHPIFRKSPELVEECFGRIVDLSVPGKCLPEASRMTRYASALNTDYFDLSKFQPAMDHPFTSYLKNRTYQDMFRETAPCCLRAEDRQATAFNLDNYLPFFDHRLIEFMFRVSGQHKIRDGVTKRLLRTATQGILPEGTRTRITKTGWNAPAHVWFSGTCREDLMDLIHSRTFRERGIYNVAEVERIAEQHQRIIDSGELVENHMMFLWQLVNLELWLQSLADPRNDALGRSVPAAAIAEH